MGFTEHLEFVQILWTLSVMEHITSGISFSIDEIFLCDYVNELCEILVGPLSYRKSKGQYGEKDGIEWNACLPCIKRSMFLYLIGCILL